MIQKLGLLCSGTLVVVSDFKAFAKSLTLKLFGQSKARIINIHKLAGHTQNCNQTNLKKIKTIALRKFCLLPLLH